jgi:SPP1 gp7 family putative phage head morphogenesis protein
LGSPEELESLRVRSAAAREDALEDRAGRVFSYMNETTVEGVYATIERGIDEGKTVKDIADDLRSKFSDIDEIGGRAMTIARTETLTAVSLGQASAMKDAAKLVPKLVKMWISANDDRVRDSHEMLHGDIVAHDKDFANGLQFPRDPSGPPEEVINCRCTWIMLPKDQMQNIDDSLEAEEELES